jgi:hypothetical protein
MSSRRKIQKTTRERLVPILSAEQLKEFDTLQAEWAQQRQRQQRSHQRRGGRG